MKFILLFTILLVLSGCTTLSVTTEGPGEKIEILSKPPGAKIEVNNDYLCDAPCNIYVQRPGFWDMEECKSLLVTAIPSERGHYVQKKHLSCDDKLPRRIFFDMRLHSVSPTEPMNIDINMNSPR